MKRMIPWLLTGALALTAMAAGAATGEVAGAGASAALTVQQILDRHVAARGGADAWRKIQSMGWTGRIESGAGGISKTPFLMLFRRPDATRFEVMAQGQRSVRVFDGSKGWKMIPTASGVPDVKEYSEEEISFARDAVGLGGQGAGDAEGGGAEADQIARFQVQTVEHQRVGEQAVMAVAVHQRGVDGLFGRRLGRSHQGPGGVHGFEFDQGALAGGGDQEGAHHGHLGGLGTLAGEPLPQGGGEGGVAAIDLDVAAEDAAAIGGEARVDGGAQAAHGGDDAHAQSQAEQHGGETADTSTQFAAGEAEGEGQHEVWGMVGSGEVEAHGVDAPAVCSIRVVNVVRRGGETRGGVGGAWDGFWTRSSLASYSRIFPT